jgi:hypothetical protein
MVVLGRQGGAERGRYPPAQTARTHGLRASGHGCSMASLERAPSLPQADTPAQGHPVISVREATSRSAASRVGRAARPSPSWLCPKRATPRQTRIRHGSCHCTHPNRGRRTGRLHRASVSYPSRASVEQAQPVSPRCFILPLFNPGLPRSFQPFSLRVPQAHTPSPAKQSSPSA